MKFLLAAVNAKYIHSNLGIYSLRKYAQERLKKDGDSSARIEMAEYTINHQMEYILQDIYRRSPDVVGFSCYIWNILYVTEIIRDLRKVMPGVHIWLGGPEVSYHASEFLEQETAAELIMTGEGEETFFRLVKCFASCVDADEKLWKTLSEIRGIVYRGKTGEVRSNAPAPLMDLSEIPFSYDELDGLEHRIIYYESSRGCPFSCSYCLSSIDKTVRFRSLKLVKKELEFFLERKVPQVKFVDRTFNCRKSHSMEIWNFILEHDNGVTNFHFEISADLLDEEELALMERMRPGLIQLEIGVQTTNPDTIREIRRKMDLLKLAGAVSRVNSFHNIHQHLDLIAGLPCEGLESFKRSFNDVYRMEPEQLQLGFLKVLKGSYMEEKAADYGLLYQSRPPYEVLSTAWLSYGELIRLKQVEEMVEVHYNSGQFRTVLRELLKEFEEPYDLYEALAEYYDRNEPGGISYNRLARYEILYRFIEETGRGRISGNELKRDALKDDVYECGMWDNGAQTNGVCEDEDNVQKNGRNNCRDSRMERYRDALMYDLYLRENIKSRPSFARDQTPFKEMARDFFIREAKNPVYLHGYDAYDSRQISKMAHLEGMADGSLVLFDYKNRDTLYGNAKAVRLSF